MDTTHGPQKRIDRKQEGFGLATAVFCMGAICITLVVVGLALRWAE